MATIPACPICGMDNTYQDGDNLVCPDCSHEWPMAAPAGDAAEGEPPAERIKDANGTPLADGDTVILVKDLKVKGASITLKKGTKVKRIRLVGGDHDVDCKIDGISLSLKSEFLKKA
jgi:protein PhnA